MVKQVPDDGLMINYDSILLRFLHEPHWDAFYSPSDAHFSYIVAGSKNACINQEQPPVLTRIDCTVHLHRHSASKPIRNKYFNIFDDEIEL